MPEIILPDEFLTFYNMKYHFAFQLYNYLIISFKNQRFLIKDLAGKIIDVFPHTLTELRIAQADLALLRPIYTRNIHRTTHPSRNDFTACFHCQKLYPKVTDRSRCGYACSSYVRIFNHNKIRVYTGYFSSFLEADFEVIDVSLLPFTFLESAKKNLPGGKQEYISGSELSQKLDEEIPVCDFCVQKHLLHNSIAFYAP